MNICPGKVLIWASVIMATIISQSVSAQNSTEKSLLAEAIVLSKTITNDMATKDKLDAYETIIGKIDTLLENYSGTDIGLKILSGEKIGNFNPQKIRSEYLISLSDYYDVVCETSPSYSCLAFVSLKNADELCRTGAAYQDLYQAHSRLINAYKIFSGQGMENYANLALSTYKTCKKSVRKLDDGFDKESFLAQLVDVLIARGDKQKARGIIENMKIPYFKFRGVLALSKATGRVPDQKFVDRMYKYLFEKLIRSRPEPKFFARRQVTTALAKMSLYKYYSGFDFQGSSGKPPKLDWNKLVAFDPKSLRGFEMYDPNCKGKLSSGFFSDLSDWQLANPRIAGRVKGIENALKACRENGRQFSLGIRLIGKVAEKNVGVAKEIKSYVLGNVMSQTTLAKFTLDKLVKSKGDVKWLEIFKNIHHNKAFTSLGKDLPYLIFTKYVDLGEVCEASKRLFMDVKKTARYDDAIAYMIESPNVDPSIKYKCGDEDLELLLKG